MVVVMDESLSVPRPSLYLATRLTRLVQEFRHRVQERVQARKNATHLLQASYQKGLRRRAFSNFERISRPRRSPVASVDSQPDPRTQAICVQSLLDDLDEHTHHRSASLIKIAADDDLFLNHSSEQVVETLARTLSLAHAAYLFDLTSLLIDRLEVLQAQAHQSLSEAAFKGLQDEKFVANLTHLLRRLQYLLFEILVHRSLWQIEEIAHYWQERGRQQNKLDDGWFAEWPSGQRLPSTTSFPWNIRPSLVVLWGVCWMFYEPNHVPKVPAAGILDSPGFREFWIQNLVDETQPEDLLGVQAVISPMGEEGLNASEAYLADDDTSSPANANNMVPAAHGQHRPAHLLSPSQSLPGAEAAAAARGVDAAALGDMSGTRFAAPQASSFTHMRGRGRGPYGGGAGGGGGARGGQASPSAHPGSTSPIRNPFAQATHLDYHTFAHPSHTGIYTTPSPHPPSTGFASEPSWPDPTGGNFQQQTYASYQDAPNVLSTAYSHLSHSSYLQPPPRSVAPQLTIQPPDAIHPQTSFDAFSPHSRSTLQESHPQHLYYNVNIGMGEGSAQYPPSPARSDGTGRRHSIPVSASESLTPTTPTMANDHTSPSSAGSATRQKLSVKRDRDPPRNKDSQIYCDHESCRSNPPTFRRPCEWNKHMDKHERPYRCKEPGCDKVQGFTYSGGLLRHQREVHKKNTTTKKPLMCPHSDCNRSSGHGFSRLENLKEHLRRRHMPTDGQAPDQLAEQVKEEAEAETSARKRKRAPERTEAPRVEDAEDSEDLREQVKRLKREGEEKDRRLRELEDSVQALIQQQQRR